MPTQTARTSDLSGLASACVIDGCIRAEVRLSELESIRNRMLYG